jgi:secondary thiamine-phosphate synthase enzyme
MHRTLELSTTGPGLTEITRDVAAVVSGQGDGLLTLLVQHTSASLLIQENADPDVQRDLMGFFGRLVPRGDDPAMRWLSHTMEGPDDMPAHIKAALLPVSLQVPVRAGRLILGTWQGIYLVEHRDRPHRRQVALHFAAD